MMGDSIRSMIGKPKKGKASVERPATQKENQSMDWEKKTRRQRINGSADEPSYGLRGPRSRPWRLTSPGAARAEARTAARSRSAPLCYHVEGYKERYAEYDGCCIEPLGRVYIRVQVLGVKKAILEIRQEMITNHILPNTHIPNISLTATTQV